MPRRHRALARPCTPCGHGQHPPCPAHHLDAGVRTKFPPPRMPFTAPIVARCALSHVSARSLCHHAELSHHLPPSLSPCAGPRCLYAIRSYKRDLPCAFCPHPHRCLPLVSHRCCPTSVFYRSIGAKPSHPTSLSVRRSRSFLELQSCFLNQEGDTFTTIELRRHRPHR
jgi:hypothetical protein